jgi:hypothetical protein
MDNQRGTDVPGLPGLESVLKAFPGVSFIGHGPGFWASISGELTLEKSRVVWKERHEHSAFVFQDKIWVAGGHAKPLSSEVWSLDIPDGWFQGK